ncbi:hypothetical protein BD410DRAFT_719993 [Rickenella mellea]|uniref:Uncharacterized protein n=1 Tax=Rickenella mellea TaxID=50990 RepID=A0A4Y7Q9U0_9AGAM|nr:hypothetical protein BD410DRAFT_719993 [Rickenella mellea]
MRAWSIITTFIFYTLIIPLVYAIPRNKTIDDVFGDDTTAALPTYSPGTAWHRGDQCDGCLVQPDTTQAFDGTWHDATHSAADTQPVFMELSFNGSAIYVYGILANQVPFATTATNLTFTLDGAVVGTFVHVPDSSSDFIYNVPFYTNPSLPMGQHTLHIESNAVTQSALILFDYAIYTYVLLRYPHSASVAYLTTMNIVSTTAPSPLPHLPFPLPLHPLPLPPPLPPPTPSPNPPIPNQTSQP